MSRKFRGILLVTTVALAIAFVLPATAMAITRRSTRIYGLKSGFTVNNSNPATTAPSPIATGKLQRYYGGRWVNWKGTLKLYRYNDDTSSWKYITSKYVAAGSYFKFPLSKRGLYKVVYSGTTYHKPTYKKTTRKDQIVSSFSASSVVVTDLGDGNSSVLLTSSATWNQTAYPNMIGLVSSGVILYDPLSENPDDMTMLISARSVRSSGSYQTTWRVANEELYSDSLSFGTIEFLDDYILTKSYGSPGVF